MRFTVTALGGASRSIGGAVRGIVRYLVPGADQASPMVGQGAAGGGPATYYADRGEAPGRWQGRDAENLRLVGTVEAEDLARLLSGRDPATGERLISAGGSAGRRQQLGVGSATRWDDLGRVR